MRPRRACDAVGTPPPAGVSPPVQERSRATYEALLDATERLLRDREFDALRVEELLAAASVSAGSFYARFTGKEALLPALLERYSDEIERYLARGAPHAPPEASLDERARIYVADRLRRLYRRRGLLRTLTLECRRDPALGRGLEDLTDRLNQRFVQYFLVRADEIAGPDREATILRGVYFVAAIGRDRALFATSPHAASVRLSRARFEADLATLLVGYLRSGGGDGALGPRGRAAR